MSRASNDATNTRDHARSGERDNARNATTTPIPHKCCENAASMPRKCQRAQRTGQPWTTGGPPMPSLADPPAQNSGYFGLDIPLRPGRTTQALAVGPTMAWPIQIYVAKKTSMFPQRPFRYSSSPSRPKDGEPPTSVGRLHRSRTELYSSTYPYRARSQLCPWRRGRSRASHRHPMEHGTRNPSKHWILEWSRLRECSPFPHHRQRP